MIKRILNVVIEPVAFMGVFILTLNRLVWGGGWQNLTGATFAKVYPECMTWILIGALFLWLGREKLNGMEYLQAWKRNWIVLVFIFLAACSIFWSQDYAVSIYKVFVLIACAVVASYIAIVFPASTVLRKLSYFFILAVSLSYLFAIFFPVYANVYPYPGGWRGWFSIKNMMGPLMAFGALVFLLKIGVVDRKTPGWLMSFLFFIFTAALAILSQSATAIFLMVILDAALALVYAWVKLKDRLHRIHYLVIVAVLICLLILVLLNLGFVFGLLHKDTTLTGRLQLWSYLFNNGLSHHPWFGDGFGATWVSSQFKFAAQAAAGWGITPFTSHNGLLETFMGLGFVGAILMLGVVVLALYRGIRHALKERSLESFMPLLFLLFVITSNITESYLLELESFTWFLLIYALFSTTSLTSNAPVEARSSFNNTTSTISSPNQKMS